MCTQRSAFLSGLLGAVLLLPGATAFAQQPAAPPGIGVVTAIQGQATVARQALPQPASLRFKDDVFFRDQITTQERSTIRLLLGGKGVLTVREQSQVTLDETVAPDGSRRSVLSLLAGKIGAAIARSLMRTGDEVEIRTPNAVAAVRGTAFVVEYVPPQKSAGTTKPVLLASSAPGPYLAQAPGASDGKSNFFVFSGSVTITPQGQPPVTLGPMQAMSVTATPGGVQSGTVQNITPADAARAAQGLEAGKPHIGEAGGSRIALAQLQIAAAVAGNIVQSVGRQPPSLSVIRELTTRPPGTYTNVTGVGPVIASENATSSGTGGTTPPPPPPPPPPGTANALPSGTILSLNNSGVSMSGASIAEFSGGAANTIVPVDISGTPGTVYDPTNPNRVTSPLLPAIGSPVSHSGPMGSLNNFTLFGFDVTTGTDITTPLARITGTSLTNTDGPLFSMTGNSELFTDGPLLSLENGGSATLAGVLAMSGDPSSETSALAFVGSADGVSIPSGTSLIATAPLFTLTGNSVLADFSTAPTSGGTQAGNGPGGAGLFSVGGTLTLTGNGALLSATDSSAVVVGSLLSSSGGTINMNGTGAAVQLDNATLALPNGGSLISLNNGASLTASGPALDAVNGGGVVLGGDGGGGPIFALRGGSRVNWTGGPLIHLDSSTLIADGGFGDSDGTGNVVNISGTAGAAAVLLDATDTNITFGGSRIPNAGTTDTDVTTFSAPAGVPLIRLTRSTYSDTSPDSELVPHSDGTTTFDGLFVVASSSDITLAGKVLDLCCGERITTTATTPLLQFDQSNLTVSGSFLRVADGGQLTSTSTDPLVPLIRLTGGIHDIGTAVGPNTGALMDLRGVNQDASGLGTDQVLKVGGPVFQANGATVNVGGSGNAVRVDTALLAASAPIVKLISSTMDVRSGDTTLGAMSLVQSKVTSNGPVFGLNNSILTVQNGPLLSLSGGTQMTVTGNLLDLSGGSQIKVFNGPLIFVDGGAATTKSTLNISGGLVNFGGTGNQVIINNNTSPTATFTRNGVSIPVSMTSGATVNMGPNVIGNPAGNTFSVTGTAPSFIPTVGVAIQGVNGARIGINAAP